MPDVRRVISSSLQAVARRDPLLPIGPPATSVVPACPIVAAAAECKRLKQMAYGHKTEHRLRVRAQIVLHAARGRSNARISHETGLQLDTGSRLGRFAHVGWPALADRKRSGRPARFIPVQVAEAMALACQLPAEAGVPLSRWSCPELAAELRRAGSPTASQRPRASLVARGRAQALAVSVLDLHPRPGLRAKAQRVLDLYARMFEGVPLGEDEYVVSIDENMGAPR